MQRLQTRFDVCRERGMVANVLVPRTATSHLRRGGAYRFGRSQATHTVWRSVLRIHTIDYLFSDVSIISHSQ